jgi:murein DD-endopeptidase MepM/ murein hydrolase activator NlpD
MRQFFTKILLLDLLAIIPIMTMASNDENNNCQATYLPEKQILHIPCLDNFNKQGDLLESYFVDMLLVPNTNPTQNGINDNCRASYCNKDGRIDIPCIDTANFFAENYVITISQMPFKKSESPKSNEDSSTENTKLSIISDDYFTSYGNITTTNTGIRYIQIIVNNDNKLKLRKKLKEDGKWGSKTKTAVKHFQRYYGLIADGIVGQKTKKKLYKVLNRLRKNPSNDNATTTTLNATNFLHFPLNGTHKDIGISSVFDHSRGPNIIAFDGTTGKKIYGKRAKNSTCYKTSIGKAINLPGVKYLGVNRKNKYLCYNRHRGIDYVVPTGTNVYASADGIVEHAGWQSSNPRRGFGKYVRLSHSNGYMTYYGHLNSINVSKKQRVKKGELLGKSGNTGHSSGPHLHFEVRTCRFGKCSIDPFAKANDLWADWEYDGTPEVIFTMTPENANLPLTVSLDASESIGRDGKIESYNWSTSDGQTATDSTAKFSFNKLGTYSITLTVTDDIGNKVSLKKVVTVVAFFNMTSDKILKYQPK